MIQESVSHADDLANPIDSSSFLFEKLNNSKENSELMKQIKKPKPRKLEPINGNGRALQRTKTRDPIANSNINEEDEEGNESERGKGIGLKEGPKNTDGAQISDRASIVKAEVANQLRKNSSNK